MKHVDKVLSVIKRHPQGVDDDEISEITGITPRQQIYQICTRLAAQGRIDRRSVAKGGKRRKIHNFPARVAVLEWPVGFADSQCENKGWRHRAFALEAATGLPTDMILDQALRDFALKVLAGESRRIANDDSRDEAVMGNTPSDERPPGIDTIWERIDALQGEEFHQIRGKSFSYRLVGASVRPSTTNRLIPRSDFEEALDCVPLANTVAVQHLQGPSYIYAILMDPRVRGGYW